MDEEFAQEVREWETFEQVLLDAERVFERVSSIFLLFLCSSLVIYFWSLSEMTYQPSWMLVRFSLVISMVLWSGTAWMAKVEQKKAETWSCEKTFY